MMFVLFCQRDRNRHLDSVIALVCFSFATGKSRSVHSQPWKGAHTWCFCLNTYLFAVNGQP